MKKINCLYVLISAVLLLGFSGCKKEQTEMDINNSQYHATIQGTLYYPAGTAPNDYNGKPAANQTVFVDVPYYYYSETATGTKRFTTTTDSQGKFSIQIPAKVASITAYINVESFAGQHYFFDQFIEEGGAYVPKFVQKNVVYQIGSTPVTVSASKIEHKNLLLTYNVTDVEPEFNFMAVYKFEMEKMYYNRPDGPPYTTPAIQWIPQASTDVVVEVTRDGQKNFYIGKSDGNGLASVQIPIRTLTETVSIVVKANPYRGTLTTYEVSEDQETFSTIVLNGVYLPDAIYASYATLNALQAVPAPYNMLFYFNKD
ncbi:MAG: hypothetical protein FWC34_02310 [Bacteroidetes bacterium]|nr:hypothetical protein [Bacteroidota bacterium]MCL2301710.1 hypothetical protein [Lentimicrobiaceae bacterium]